MRRRWGRLRWLPLEEPWPGSSIETKVEPRDGEWYWEASYRPPPPRLPPPVIYSEWFSRSQPRPYAVCGSRKTHADARSELATATNAMRAVVARVTAEQNHRDALRYEETILS